MKADRQPPKRSKDAQEDQTDSAPAISVPGSGTVDSKYNAELTESANAVESAQSHSGTAEQAAEDDEASTLKKVSIGN